MEHYITLRQKISLDHFEDIIVSALEGGSNYWYDIDTTEFRSELVATDREPLSSRIAGTLFANSKFKMNVYDVEDGIVPGSKITEEKPLGVVSQESMLKAIQMAYVDYPHVYHDLMEGTGDAGTADILFQLAVMGEVVFG